MELFTIFQNTSLKEKNKQMTHETDNSCPESLALLNDYFFKANILH